jgi:hypothetical protein
MSRARQLAVPIIVSILFGATMWGGLAAVGELAATQTAGQRFVTLMDVTYGLVSIPALYGVWRPRSWFPPIVAVWAVLVIVTATSAVAVYEGGMVGTLSAFFSTVLIAGPTYLWARRRTRQSDSTRTETGAAPISGA